MVYLCKMMISWNFFQFFKISIFWVVSGVKGQKTFQNDKEFCSSCFISQEPYITWLSFMVPMCKIIIFSGVFFSIFQNFDFSGCKRAKNSPKLQKILSVALHISVTIHRMTVIYGTHLYVFFIFSKFWFLGFLGR